MLVLGEFDKENATMTETKGPLEGILVIDLTIALAGPFASTLLGDLGAEVIHIERAQGGDFTRQWVPTQGDLGYYFAIGNRGKKSMTLDLKTTEGTEIFLRLAKEADIIVENFVPGVVDRLGIGYDKVKEINPGIVYCHVSGFGQDGPYRDRPAFDQVLQGESGIISYTGTEDNPCKVNVPITDYLSSLYAAYAVLAALFQRKMTGRGMDLDVSLFDCSVSMMLNLLNMHCVAGMTDRELRMGYKYFLATPYEPYPTADESWVNICVLTEPHWRAFCRATGLDHICDDPRFKTNRDRLAHREELTPIIEARIREKPRDEWVEIFLSAGVPCGAVNSIGEVLEHPQLKHRKTILDIEYPGIGKIKVFNNPVKFSDYQVDIRRPPKMGEHTDEVLARCGYTESERVTLRQKGIV
jgi:formyl-CoA transferase/CoA:oxalate CoA-transferase